MLAAEAMLRGYTKTAEGMSCVDRRCGDTRSGLGNHAITASDREREHQSPAVGAS